MRDQLVAAARGRRQCGSLSLSVGTAGLRTRIPFYAVSLAFASLFAGALFADPEWISEPGVESVKCGPSTLVSDGPAVDPPTPDGQFLAKQRVAADIIAGRMSLLTAAERFRSIYRNHARDTGTLRLVFHAGSEDEALCRNVIAFVEIAVQDDPQNGPPTLARLQREFDDFLAGRKSMAQP
jgi:hypothetical protein